MFLPTVAVADDAEDAKAAMLNHYAKRNAGDAAAYVQLHSPNRSNFGGAGQLLNRSDSLEDLENQKNNLQAQLDAGGIWQSSRFPLPSTPSRRNIEGNCN